MAVRQVFLPRRHLRAALDVDGIRLSTGGSRVERSDLPALSLGVGPGEELLALGADACLYQIAPRRRQRVWEGIDAFCADPGLLSAVQDGQRLLLQSARAATSVALPSHPLGLASLGGRDGTPHLSVVLFDDGAWLITWDEDEGQIKATELLHAAASDTAALEGVRPLLAVREAPHLGATRVHLWSVVHDGDALRVASFPLLLTDPALPLGLRSEKDGPVTLCGTGTWARWEGRWSFQVGPQLSGDCLMTRIYGTPAALEPAYPAFDKEPLPRSNKLAVSRLAHRA